MNDTHLAILIEKFSNRTLSAEEWDHEAHIKVALWHNHHFGFEEALKMVREKIIAYNEFVGTKNSEDVGYHETLTRFWMVVTRNFLLENSFPSLEKAFAEFIKSSKADKYFPMEYYSREVLFSKKARKVWVDGDLIPVVLLEEHFRYSDDDFEHRFENCTLDPALFSHEAHLRLAWIHIDRYGIVKARKNVRKQLKSYVAAVRASDKYNTTLTVAATNAVYHFMLRTGSDNFKDFILEFPRLKYGFKGLMDSHYGFDIFDSAIAKTMFLEPDLLPFD